MNAGAARDRLDSPAVDESAYCVNALVHLRRIAPDGTFPLDTATYSALDGVRAEAFLPWFDRWLARRAHFSSSICIGHWSDLGGLNRPPFHGLDLNCGGRGQLAALQLETRRLFTVACDG